MLTRTRTETVVLKHPFQLAGLELEQPAGEYVAEIDEELLTGVSFVAYRRTNVILHLKARSQTGRPQDSIWLDPKKFDEILQEDCLKGEK